MKNNTIVSLADSNYFDLLNELVDSILKFPEGKNVDICILDAGLSNEQKSTLLKKVKEIKKAESLNLLNYQLLLLDKYSIQFKNFLKKNKFDLIIDANLKSYSCCQVTFEYMIHNIFESINPNGLLVTSLNGMKWFKNLKPKLSFSFKKLFFFKLKEINGNKDNVLSPSELEFLSQKYNFKMSFDEKLCYLKK